MASNEVLILSQAALPLHQDADPYVVESFPTSTSLPHREDSSLSLNPPTNTVTPSASIHSHSHLIPSAPLPVHSRPDPVPAPTLEPANTVGSYESHALDHLNQLDNNKSLNRDPESPPPFQGQNEFSPSKRHFLEGRSKLFKTTFIVTTLSAQLIAQGQFGMVVIALTEIGEHLHTTSPGELSWMAASYGLTVGMFLIASGRLGDIFGPKRLFLLGFIVTLIACLASGFCTTRIPFDITRALGGIGAALSVPNAVAIFGRTYPPGQMRATLFAALGALGPVGFMSSGALAALLADKASVPWIWWFTSIFVAVFIALGVLVLPPDEPFPSKSTMYDFDYIGSLLLVVALGLFNFTWNQAPLVGWGASYVWSMLIVSLVVFAAFFFWERRMGRRALIPPAVLSKTSLLVYLSLWLGWMSFGTFLLYTTLFIRNIRGASSALELAAQMSPCCPGGAIAALIVPTLLTRFAGHQIFFVSMVAFLIGDIMAAVTPADSSYWAVTFPSLLLVISGPDLSFSTGQLIVSNSVDREFQGIAAGIVSMITNYSLSIGLGLAGTVESYVAPNGPLLKGYRAAFYFATALSAIAVLVVGLFVRMPKMAQYRE